MIIIKNNTTGLYWGRRGWGKKPRGYGNLAAALKSAFHVPKCYYDIYKNLWNQGDEEIINIFRKMITAYVEGGHKELQWVIKENKLTYKEYKNDIRAPKFSFPEYWTFEKWWTMYKKRNKINSVIIAKKYEEQDNISFIEMKLP